MANKRLEDKIRRALNRGRVNGLDMVRRSDYATRDAYLDAATKAELEREVNGYGDIYARLDREYAAIEEKAAREAERERFAALTKSAAIYDSERKGIEIEARKKADADLTAGRISIGQHAERMMEYAKAGELNLRKEKASAAQFNEAIRATVGENVAKLS